MCQSLLKSFYFDCINLITNLLLIRLFSQCSEEHPVYFLFPFSIFRFIFYFLSFLLSLLFSIFKFLFVIFFLFSFFLFVLGHHCPLPILNILSLFVNKFVAIKYNLHLTGNESYDFFVVIAAFQLN